MNSWIDLQIAYTSRNGPHPDVLIKTVIHTPLSPPTVNLTLPDSFSPHSIPHNTPNSPVINLPIPIIDLTSPEKLSPPHHVILSPQPGTSTSLPYFGIPLTRQQSTIAKSIFSTSPKSFIPAWSTRAQKSRKRIFSETTPSRKKNSGMISFSCDSCPFQTFNFINFDLPYIIETARNHQLSLSHVNNPDIHKIWLEGHDHMLANPNHRILWHNPKSSLTNTNPQIT